jgi:putative ABC transport system substrate-binding protein
MSGSMPTIGVIVHRGRDTLFNAFVKSLADHGYVEGETIALEPRFAEGVLERTTGFAEDLVARKVDAIVAIGAVGARAAQRASDQVPIVYSIVLDPVEAGFAATLDRPGGNMAGVTNYDPNLAVEQLTLLKKTVPDLKRLAILSDVDIPRSGGWNPLERSNEIAARSLGLEPQWIRIKSPTPDRAAAFQAMVDGAAQALQVLEVPVCIADFQSVASLAIEHRLPTMFPGGWQHEGLLAYGTSLLQTVPELPSLIGLILNGSNPGDIPVRNVRQHHLRLNLATARRIGLDVSREVVERASEVISIDG